MKKIFQNIIIIICFIIILPVWLDILCAFGCLIIVSLIIKQLNKLFNLSDIKLFQLLKEIHSKIIDLLN